MTIDWTVFPESELVLRVVWPAKTRKLLIVVVPSTQWAAVRIHSLEIIEPPQNWPSKLLASLVSINATCQGVREMLIESPPTILAVICPSRGIADSDESANALGAFMKLSAKTITNTLLTIRCIFETVSGFECGGNRI